MKINIKHECNYEYKITLKVCESDFMKIIKILTNNIVFQIIEEPLIENNKHYLVELNIIQIKDLLNYFLEKNECLEKTLDKYSNN